MTGETSVKLPVTVTKNPGRKSGYTATYGPWQSPIEAQGATASEARANLTGALVTAIGTITTARPAFAREDDSGVIWAAVPAFDGGSDWYRVTETARRNSSTNQPASEAFTTCVGMTVVPSR